MSRPIILGLDKTVAPNSSIAASELFTLVANTDPISTYFFQDFNATPSTGYFTLDGVPQVQGSLLTVAAADLVKLRYVGGTNIASERFRVYARDAAGRFSDAAVTGRVFTSRANTTVPFAKANSFSVVGNESVAGPNVLSGFDPDGHPILHFRVRDLNLDNGYFILNGVGQTQGSFFMVNEKDLPKLKYYSNGPTSSTTSSEQIEVQSFDGVHYSTVSRGTVTSIINASRPVVNFVSTGTLGNQSFKVVPRTDVFDSDPNTMKRFRFMNNSPHANRGDLVLNGVVQPRQTWIDVFEADFENFVFVPKNEHQTQTLRYQSFDGKHWSTGINTIEIKTTKVQKPSLEAVNPDPYGTHLTEFNFAPMVRKTDDGIPFTEYEIFDARLPDVGEDNKTGRFRVNGINVPSGTIRRLTAAQFQNVTYFSGAAELQGRESLYVRANNGQSWSDWTKLDFSTHPEINNALRGNAGWGSPAVVGATLPRNSEGKLILTYSFFDVFPEDYETGEATDGDRPEHFASFTAQQRVHARMAFDHLESIANVQLVEIPDTATNALGQRGGIFRLGEYGLASSNAGAFAFFPSPSPEGGDQWYNRLTMDTRFLPGTGGFSTILHELGHALGMKHPHTGFGVLHPDIDSSDRSAMTYNSPPFRNSPSFQIYDINYLQSIYGVNSSFNAGDDLYNLERFLNRQGAYQSPEEQDLVFETIWDGGGIDTLSAKGSMFDATVDLRQGMPSSIGFTWNLEILFFTGEFVETAVVDNIRIAIGTNIENGEGSSLNDRLIGNYLGNTLSGQDGDDYLWGGKGTDFLRGGMGDDTYEFGVGDGFNVITEGSGSGGNETLKVSSFPGLDAMSDDLAFRRVGLDLVVDLRLNRGDSQGIARITNQFAGGPANQVETLELNGVRIDLVDLTSKITGVNVNQRFTPRNIESSNGFLVTSVI